MKNSWITPFRRFHSSKSDIHDLDRVSKWLFAARSVILIISVQAAIVAGILAYIADRFDAVSFILVLIGFVVAHAASNLMNDYFGYFRGHDTTESPRLRYTIHPIADKVASKRQLAAAVLILVVTGLAIAVYFTLVRGYVTLLFLAAGVFFLLMYDAFPVTLKTIGLGEISAFIVWGPLMIGGGYFLISGQLSYTPFLVAVPYGLGVMSILIGKHLDQINFDSEIGQHTLPVVLGERRGRALNIAVILLMYISTLALVALSIAPIFVLFAFLNIPFAIFALKRLFEPRPRKPPKDYIGWPLWYHRSSLRHNRTFGWLYITGLVLTAVAPVLWHISAFLGYVILP